MENDEYYRLWQKARRFAEKRGFGVEAEDFASDLICRKLDGKARRQTLEQSFIDYSSALRADKRILGSPSGYCSKNITESLDKPIRTSDNDGPTIGDFIGGFRNDLEWKSNIERINSILTNKERLIFNMLYEQGMSQKEIGYNFGLSESRVSQLVTRINTKILKLNEDIEIYFYLSKHIKNENTRIFCLNKIISSIKDNNVF